MARIPPIWNNNPAPALEAAFRHIAATRMAGLPIANPMLAVEAVAFRRYEKSGHWLGVLITPWAINLLLLPAPGAPWPAAGPGGKHTWHFPSGDYEFTIAGEEALGTYHLCSLFSPPAEFHSQEEARQTAYAVLAALMLEGGDAAPSPASGVSGRRAFLGLGR
ncbi:[NiFe]-hydrogenase assembly chaperone HybE [Azovibrio restrictus]|uniref:[NiFe]-hydrogenase assembly chaperone HybE n=1 Tax=Azovibrio restrictus TaxID=146938 RepID=UPI0026ECB548|nr:[NiFe]-hydrogenase assembly chaperone HybE [Azovibrio restrictus]